jgi:hypothetical protein
VRIGVYIDGFNLYYGARGCAAVARRDGGGWTCAAWLAI